MKRIAAVVALMLATGAVPVWSRTTVIGFPLPRHATIATFGPKALMAAGPDGSLAATVTIDGYLRRPVLWSRSGRYETFDVDGTIDGFDNAGALLVDASRPLRLERGRLASIDLRDCENFPQFSVGATVTGTLSNGTLIATMRSPAIVNLDDTSGSTAPVVLHLRDRRCLNLGNGVALATAGMYAAGYTGYIAGVPAPSNVVSDRERFVAMRWLDRERQSLGPGAALAIDASGEAAGADVPPEHGGAFGVSPHARYWNASGVSQEIVAQGLASAAYAIDARGRVTGVLLDAQGRHRAFLWQNGRLRTLDDIAGAPDWRFECGYAFTPSGAVVGIGTYRGRPEAFEIEGL
ncbi:MAG TPA: hypothetical protein VGK84_01725 [Candidatus Tumulicola sp.]|jgi:hypothetical protein